MLKHVSDVDIDASDTSDIATELDIPYVMTPRDNNEVYQCYASLPGFMWWNWVFVASVLFGARASSFLSTKPHEWV